MLLNKDTKTETVIFQGCDIFAHKQEKAIKKLKRNAYNRYIYI